MPIAAADPRAKELDAAFEQAMSGLAKPRSEPKTPPEIDPEAPFGRDDSGAPIEKYGRHPDGRIKRSAGGRPPKNAPDAARVTDRPEPEKPKEGKVIAGPDYTADLVEAADGFWLMGTSLAKLPLGRLRVGKIGFPRNASDVLSAQAYILHQHKFRLAAALNEAAHHNGRAKHMAEKLAGGDLTWVLTVGALAAPFIAHSAAVWKGEEALAEMEMPTLAELAKRNEAQMGAYMDQIAAEAARIQEEADAQARAQQAMAAA